LLKNKLLINVVLVDMTLKSVSVFLIILKIIWIGLLQK
jgi:hypothetical protein